VAKSGEFDEWQLIVILDDADLAKSTDKFLWATWTRFDPAMHIHAKETLLQNNHIKYVGPIVIDARMKPWYPKEVEPRADIVERVDRRWGEYFS
jgi:3-polyprenyl-4-hydroxybenzoate decarboxylase